MHVMKFLLLKIISFFYRLLSKIIYFLIPLIYRVFLFFRINSRILNQLDKLRSESHKNDDYRDTISQFMGKEKLIALDVGAQGGFFNANIFSKTYNDFFDPPYR